MRPRDPKPAAATPELLLEAYRRGLFPMAEDRHDSRLYWIEPETRGILPLAGMHVSRRLARKLRADVFEVRIDRAFREVIEGCATPAPGRWNTWINDDIIALYSELHRLGFVHSVEAWRQGRLAGGLYGVALGAAFFGESMYSRESDASKVALAHLVARLLAGGYRLLDTQFATRHLRRLGVVELARERYRARLADALAHEGDFYSLPDPVSGAAALQAITRRS